MQFSKEVRKASSDKGRWKSSWAALGLKSYEKIGTLLYTCFWQKKTGEAIALKESDYPKHLTRAKNEE